jgi:hypothetical protein
MSGAVVAALKKIRECENEMEYPTTVPRRPPPGAVRNDRFGAGKRPGRGGSGKCVEGGVLLEKVSWQSL